MNKPPTKPNQYVSNVKRSLNSILEVPTSSNSSSASLSSSQQAAALAAIADPAKAFYCLHCDVQLRDSIQYAQHLNTKAHLANLSTESESTIVETPLSPDAQLQLVVDRLAYHKARLVALSNSNSLSHTRLNNFKRFKASGLTQLAPLDPSAPLFVSPTPIT